MTTAQIVLLVMFVASLFFVFGAIAKDEMSVDEFPVLGGFMVIMLVAALSALITTFCC